MKFEIEIPNFEKDDLVRISLVPFARFEMSPKFNFQESFREEQVAETAICPEFLSA